MELLKPAPLGKNDPKHIKKSWDENMIIIGISKGVSDVKNDPQDDENNLGYE